MQEFFNDDNSSQRYSCYLLLTGVIAALIILVIV